MKKSFVFSLSLITLSALCVVCDPDEIIIDNEATWPIEPTEPAQNGAYYVISGSKEYLGTSAVIYEDYISLFWDSRADIPADVEADFIAQSITVIRFSSEEDSYSGKNIHTEISFKLSGDVLTLKFTSVLWAENKIIQFKRAPSVEVSEEEPVQLFPPVNVEYYESHNQNGIILSWQKFHLEGGEAELLMYPSNYGILGAGLEIKYAGAEDFIIVSISNFIGGPGWYFSIYIYPYLGIPQGTHIARIKHLGGPFVQDNKIRLSMDSQPLYYKLTVDSEGKMSAEEISE